MYFAFQLSNLFVALTTTFQTLLFIPSLQTSSTMIEINMSLVHQYNYNLGLQTINLSLFSCLFIHFFLWYDSAQTCTIFEHATPESNFPIDISMGRNIRMEEDFFRSFVKFLSSNQRWEFRSLTWRTDRKGEHRTLVPTNLHPASGNSMELCSKPGSKGRRDLPKGRRPQIPTPRHPPSSSCFPAICKVACAQRRPSYRHRTPRAGKFPSVSCLGEFSFHEAGSRFPPTFEFNAWTEMSV